MFKNIFKIISFILVCATAFTFVACTPDISNGDESGSDTNNGLIGGGTQAIFDESLSEDQDTEKQTDAPVTGERVIGEQTVPSSDAATDKHAETEPAPRTNLPLRFALSA